VQDSLGLAFVAHCGPPCLPKNKLDQPDLWKIGQPLAAPYGRLRTITQSCAQPRRVAPKCGLPALAPAPGLASTVSVSVPGEMVLSGKGFSFALPAEVVDAAAGENVQFAQLNGAPLPTWLECGSANKRCSVKGMPPGALPMQLLVSTRTQHWTLVISKRTSR
jgi:hypothetical protein